MAAASYPVRAVSLVVILLLVVGFMLATWPRD